MKKIFAYLALYSALGSSLYAATSAIEGMKTMPNPNRTQEVINKADKDQAGPVEQAAPQSAQSSLSAERARRSGRRNFYACQIPSGDNSFLDVGIVIVPPGQSSVKTCSESLFVQKELENLGETVDNLVTKGPLGAKEAKKLQTDLRQRYYQSTRLDKPEFNVVPEEVD